MDISIIWAQYEKSISGFLVPINTPEFYAQAIKDKCSFRASYNAEFFLEDVTIPDTALLPKTYSIVNALSCLSQARYSIGHSLTVNPWAVTSSFNQISLDDNRINGKELMAIALVKLIVENKIKFQHVSMAKMNNFNKALEIPCTCRQLLGASGIHSEYHTGH